MLLNPYRFGIPALSAPTDVALCSAWFDGRLGITHTGGAVTQWSDQSASGLQLGISTGTARPTTGVDTLNGHNVVKFDGNDWIGVESAWIYSGTSTVFIVAKSAATPASTAIILQESNGGLDPDTRYNRSPSVDQAFLVQTNDNGASAVVLNGGALVAANYHLWTIKDSGTNASISIDRAAPTSAAYTRGTATFSRTTLGATRQSGDPIGSFLTGDIATVITYDAVLSAGDTTLVENYILAVWGI